MEYSKKQCNKLKKIVYGIFQEYFKKLAYQPKYSKFMNMKYYIERAWNIKKMAPVRKVHSGLSTLRAMWRDWQIWERENICKVP